MRKALVVAMLVICAGATGAAARTWHVYVDGSGNTPTIQSAIDSAAISGDAILIQGGSYDESGIIADGKNVTISQFEGQVYLVAPLMGGESCLTFRNTVGFSVDGIALRGYGTGIVVESASGTVQLITVKGCDRGVAVSGAGSAPTVWYCLVDSCETGIEVQGGSVTLRNQTIVNCSTGAGFLGGSGTFSRTIVYNCSTGVQCSGGSVSLSCNNFYLNATDYSGCSQGTNDFYTDPKFCFWQSTAGPYWLHDTSPCITKENVCGVYVGAITTAGCTGTAVEEETWGSIKDLYR